MTSPTRNPWQAAAATRRERHDRTLGIPPREISMWPGRGPAPGRPHAADHLVAQVIGDLHSHTTPTPAAIIPATLATVLTDVAEGVHNRRGAEQRAHIDTVAARHHLNPADVQRHAAAIGHMIIRSVGGRRQQAESGRAGYNARRGANLPLAVEIHLARGHLAEVQAHTPPDLPRLWILANGLTHAVPAADLLRIPATSHGPGSRILPHHRDLVGWAGVRDAVHHLHGLLHAAQEGRRWIHHGMRDTPDAVAYAIGVLHLTDPIVAAELAANGPATLDAADLRAVTRALPVPRSIVDLSDQALKAVCDRNGWLLGTADEHTQRTLLERRADLTTNLDTLRRQVAAGDTAALTKALLAQAPTDHHLDDAAWPKNHARPEQQQLDTYLRIASTQALKEFAGITISPPGSRADAIAARWPHRILRHTLTFPLGPSEEHPTFSVDATVPTPDAATTGIEMDF
jgi:hypothetical protein